MTSINSTCLQTSMSEIIPTAVYGYLSYPRRHKKFPASMLSVHSLMLGVWGTNKLLAGDRNLIQAMLISMLQTLGGSLHVHRCVHILECMSLTKWAKMGIGTWMQRHVCLIYWSMMAYLNLRPTCKNKTNGSYTMLVFLKDCLILLLTRLCLTFLWIILACSSLPLPVLPTSTWTFN